MAIDMNPNYIGYSIVDWKNEKTYNIINSGVIDFSPLNTMDNKTHKSSDSKEKSYIRNKRRYEIIYTAKKLFELCKHFHCETFAMEDLSMTAKDNKKGKSFNKSVNNQWCRNLLSQQLRKRVLASSTYLCEVYPEYSSIIGNILYREKCLPDMILSSIEIGRRGNEFVNQFIQKRKPRKKNIVLPDFESVKQELFKSLEEFECFEPFESWQQLFSWLKKSKVRYRFLLENALSVHSDRVFSKNSVKRYIELYTFG